MRCKKCGKNIKDGAAVCPWCGTKIEPEDLEQTGKNAAKNAADHKNTEKMPEKSNVSLYAGMTVVLLVLIALVGKGCGR